MHNRFPYRGVHGNPLWIVAHGMIAMSLRIEEKRKILVLDQELKGKTWFRINPVNFRTRAEYIDQLLASLERNARDYARKVTLKGRSSKDTRVSEIMTSPVVM